MHILPREVGGQHGDLLLAFCGAGGQSCDARNVLHLVSLGDHLSHLLINWISLSFLHVQRTGFKAATGGPVGQVSPTRSEPGDEGAADRAADTVEDDMEPHVKLVGAKV